MSDEHEMRKREREHELTSAYLELRRRVAEALLHHDPMGIYTGEYPDEYDSEVSLILPKLKRCDSVGAVRRVVHDVFGEMFDEEMARPSHWSQQVAEEIWDAWQEFFG